MLPTFRIAVLRTTVLHACIPSEALLTVNNVLSYAKLDVEHVPLLKQQCWGLVE